MITGFLVAWAGAAACRPRRALLRRLILTPVPPEVTALTPETIQERARAGGPWPSRWSDEEAIAAIDASFEGVPGWRRRAPGSWERIEFGDEPTLRSTAIEPGFRWGGAPPDAREVSATIDPDGRGPSLT